MAAPATNYTMLISSVAATAICWGIYGPLLKWGHEAMASGDHSAGRMRPFICVGIAYLVVAVFAPLLAMQGLGYDNANGVASGWTGSGIYWSFIAGTAGALGAFGLLLALGSGSTPTVIMPLVFGFAPAVNTLFTLYLRKDNYTVSPFFFVGLLMLGLGAIIVLLNAPPPPKPAKKTDPGAATSEKAEKTAEKAKEKEAVKALKGEAKKTEAEKPATPEETK